jgi:hypothetical protein
MVVIVVIVVVMVVSRTGGIVNKITSRGLYKPSAAKSVAVGTLPLTAADGREYQRLVMLQTREVFHMISNFVGGSHQERGLERHCLAVVAKADIARAWCSVQRNIVSFFVSVTRNGMFLHVFENRIEQRRLNMRSIVS